jgi:hypothetical protein
MVRGGESGPLSVVTAQEHSVPLRFPHMGGRQTSDKAHGKPTYVPLEVLSDGRRGSPPSGSISFGYIRSLKVRQSM